MKTIRVLERAIAVMGAIDSGYHVLNDIHAETGIDRATILRILKTYQNEKIIYKTLSDKSYKRIPLIGNKDFYSEQHTLVSVIASPYLQKLHADIIWPSDISIFYKNKMLLLETTRRLSSLGLNKRYKFGYLIDMFSSAPGRTYLAYCSDEERIKIIEHYQKTPPENPRSQVVLRNELKQVIEKTRKDTYGSRDPFFGGAEEDISEFDDGIDAIAVPILGKNKTHGCLSIAWPRKYKLKREIISNHLDQLKTTAANMSKALDDVI